MGDALSCRPSPFSGITGASAFRTRSIVRWSCDPRVNVARGKFGLKIEPFGAITFTGRSMPSFCGTNTGYVASSRKIMRVIRFMKATVLPSNGQLNPVGTSSLEPVKSTVSSSLSISTLTLIGSRMPRLRPSSSSQPTGAS